MLAATITPVPSTSGHLSELTIEHAPVRLGLPRLDRIVVIDRIQSAARSQLRDRRLHVPGLIDHAGFEQRRLAIPAPRQREFGQRFRQHRLLQPPALPIYAAIGGDAGAPYRAVSRPRHTANITEGAASERRSAVREAG